jgi:hypothetical protein
VKKKARSAFLALLALWIVGIALIVVFFFIWVPDSRRSSTAWLNLAVGLLLYFWVTSLAFHIISRAFVEHEILPAFLLRAWAVIPYGVAAGALILLTPLLDFTLLVTLHSIILFLALTSLVLSLVVAGFARNVKDSENERTSGILNLRSEVERISLAFGRLPAENQALVKFFSSIKEDVRYIAPNASIKAAELESRAMALLADVDRTLRLVTAQSSAPADAKDQPAMDAAQETNRLLADLADCILLRKQVRM